MQLGFEHPGYLWALAAVPLIWWAGLPSIRRLGRWRGGAACLFRTLVFVIIVAALSGVRIGWKNDQISVVYLLDQSESISAADRQAMLDYAVETAREDRDRRRGDLCGVIVFGGKPSIESPPYPDDLPQRLRIEPASIQSSATNIHSAIQLAVAAMPENSKRRIVLITDGNQTSGDAGEAALSASQAGVGIDVVAVRTEAGTDVAVERLDLPAQVRADQPFEGRIVLDCTTMSSSADRQETIEGNLSVTQSAFGDKELLFSRDVTLSSGTNVITFRHELSTPANYSFEAKFVPKQPSSDLRRENNSASAFAQVGGTSRVLVVEPWNQAGTYDAFVAALRSEDIEAVVQPSNQTFSSLGELLTYDCVVLAGLPRTVGETAETITSFSDAQIEMLVRNTEQFGGGLLMLGGPESFGAGGWGGSALEAAMPVDFDIKNTKIQAVGALMLVIDSSGSMGGQKLQLCKSAAREAVRAMRKVDSIGVITFDGEAREMVPLQPIGQRTGVEQSIGRIASGGGTNMYPAFQTAYQRLSNSPAMVKHMIVLTDGRTQPGTFDQLSRRMREDGITISCVAIGQDADQPLLRRIATTGGGKFYRVTSPRAIPQIVIRESRRVSKPLIFEEPAGINANVAFPHQIISGIGDVPPVTGYVLTTPKSNALVQNVLMASRPSDNPHPILSVWQYGLGRTAALTTDAGKRWSASWQSWPEQSKLAAQLVRWLMRPSKPSDRYHVTSSLRDGEVHVIVDALDDQGGFENFLEINGVAVTPDLETIDLQFTQTSPGRYEGSFSAPEQGMYFMQVLPAGAPAPLVAATAVPSGTEFRSRQTNALLLDRIAAARPEGGQPGTLAADLRRSLTTSERTNHFRNDLKSVASFKDVWPLAVLVACGLFLSEITIRRIEFNARGWFAWARRRQPEDSEQVARLDRLNQLRKSLDQTAVDRPQRPAVFQDEAAETRPAVAAAKPSQQPAADNEADAPQSSYMDRLLETKRRMKDR
jgi:uncharacterized membrane protein